MVGFFVYDMIFLILFTLFVIIFLYRKRDKVGREGIMFLYRTKIGMKTIDYIGKKYSKILNKLKYVVIGVGFVLMSIVLYFISYTFYVYIADPRIFQEIKAPPIAPLIPYFPKLFGMQNYFPNFYFTYFIIAIGIVAVVHEFSHGIFMKLFNIKIKSTGFAFLGPILGAFVEQDNRQMEKKKNFEQMSVLAAGTFANLIFALLFFLLLIGFFYMSFVPAGYKFNMYSMATIPVAEIKGFGNFSENFTEVYAGNNIYLLSNELKEQLKQSKDSILVYHDSPAVKSNLEGIIIEFDGTKISNKDDLRDALYLKKPGEAVNVKTMQDEEIIEYELILGKHPLNDSLPYIGVLFVQLNPNEFFSKMFSKFLQFKEPSTFYSPRWNEEFVWFIYYLIWWIALINLLVALINMLPLGILDGGRFFYLTVLSITKSKKIAKKSFKAITYLILAGLGLITLIWLIRFF